MVSRAGRRGFRDAALAVGALGLALSVVACGESTAPEVTSGSVSGQATVSPAAEDAAEETTSAAGAAAPTGADGADAALPAPCLDEGDPALEGLTVRADDAVPEAALATAQELLDLAATCDTDGLVALAQQHGTTFSLGGGDAQGVFAADDADVRVRALVVVLSRFAPEVSGGDGSSFVNWPGADLEDWDRLVQEGLYTEDEVAMMQGYGAYTGWRVVVSEDGAWTFMGAGD